MSREPLLHTTPVPKYNWRKNYHNSENYWTPILDVGKVLLKGEGYGGKGQKRGGALHGLSCGKAVGRCLALAIHRLHHQAKVVPGHVIRRLKPENMFQLIEKSTLISMVEDSNLIAALRASSPKRGLPSLR